MNFKIDEYSIHQFTLQTFTKV